MMRCGNFSPKKYNVACIVGSRFDLLATVSTRASKLFADCSVYCVQLSAGATAPCYSVLIHGPQQNLSVPDPLGPTNCCQRGHGCMSWYFLAGWDDRLYLWRLQPSIYPGQLFGLSSVVFRLISLGALTHNLDMLAFGPHCVML